MLFSRAPLRAILYVETSHSTSPKVNVQIRFTLRCTAAAYRGLADHVAGAIAGVPGLLWADREQAR